MGGEVCLEVGPHVLPSDDHADEGGTERFATLSGLPAVSRRKVWLRRRVHDTGEGQALAMQTS